MLGSLARAPRPLRTSFPRYVVVGSSSVGVDVGLLAALHSIWHFPLLVAQLLAWAAALVVNYSLNHAWSFGAEGLLRRRLLRYSGVMAVSLGITLAVVLGLTHLGVFYLLAKAVAVMITSVINFTGYRFWVFV